MNRYVLFGFMLGFFFHADSRAEGCGGLDQIRKMHAALAEFNHDLEQYEMALISIKGHRDDPVKLRMCLFEWARASDSKNRLWDAIREAYMADKEDCNTGQIRQVARSVGDEPVPNKCRD